MAIVYELVAIASGVLGRSPTARDGKKLFFFEAIFQPCPRRAPSDPT